MRMLVVVLALSVVVGCTKTNPLDCSNASCTDPAHPYCDKDGSVAGVANVCIAVSCSAPSEFVKCQGDTAVSCNQAGDGYDLTSCPMGCSPAAHGCEVCTGSMDCNLAAPFCVEMSCSAMCSADDQCPGNGGSAENVYCVSGACVSCRNANDCPSGAPFCTMGSCRACTAATDCASQVCDFDNGSCVDENAIAYAAPAGNAGGPCTLTDPCSVDRAFAIVDASRHTIKLLAGTYSGGSHTITASGAVEVFGPADLTLAGLEVRDGGSLRLADLTLETSIQADTSSNTQPLPLLNVERVTFGTEYGIDCQTCTLKVSQGRFKSVLGPIGGVNQSGALIFASSDLLSNPARQPRITIDRTELDGGDPTILMAQANYTITNSIILNSGTMYGAIDVSGNNGTVSLVEFSTFYDATWNCSTGTVTSSNNIFVNDRVGAPSSTLYGSSCVHAYCLVRPQMAAINGTNNILNVDPRFVDPGMGDFHLMSSSPAIDTGDPAATVQTDYDGTARPQGARRDIGAFEYKP